MDIRVKTPKIAPGKREFQAIAEFSPDLIAIYDRNGHPVYLNPAYLQWLGNYPDIDNSDPFKSVHPEDRERVLDIFFHKVTEGQSTQGKFRMLLPNGETRHFNGYGHPIRDKRGSVSNTIVVLRDVTELTGLREGLLTLETRLNYTNRTEESFRLMAENILNYAFYLLDVEGRVTSWNPGAERMFGYLNSEIIGKYIHCFYPPESFNPGNPDIQLEIAKARGRYESSGWRMRKDQTRFWARSIIVPLYNDSMELYGFAKIIHDLSDRKNTEEDLRSYANRLRSLTHRLVDVQESERHNLARELHDTVGPNLTAMGINLKLIADSIPDQINPQIITKIDDCISLLRSTVTSLRTVIGELRPNVFDDYGLISALRSYVSQFSTRTGIPVQINEFEIPDNIPDSTLIAMFRITQEALNNIAKHSSAKDVRINFYSTGDKLKLVIEDDGVGFNPGRIDLANPAAGFGLIIMRERAEAIGAEFVLDAVAGRGVRINIIYKI